MPGVFNYKICDMAAECDVIVACKTGAVYFSKKLKRPVINNSKCINCGKCKNSCIVDAFFYAKDKIELEGFKQQIRQDKRTRKDLLVDRYGAQSIDPRFFYSTKRAIEHIGSMESKPTVIEFFQLDSTSCLLNSNPIKEIIPDESDIVYMKVNTPPDSELARRFKLKEFPSLVICQGQKFIGKIDGFYGVSKKKELKAKIAKILSEINPKS